MSQSPVSHENNSAFRILPLLSAVFYTVSNACMRHLAGQGADVHLSIAIRESVAFYFALPLFLWLAFTGRTKWPSPKVFLTFFGIALAVQMVGNVLFLQAFAVIGMAVSVAGNWMGVLLGTPVVAYLMLRERISLRIGISLAIILVALAALTVGIQTREMSGADFSQNLQWLSIRMLLLTVMVGLINAVSCTYIRYMANLGYSPLLTVTMLPGVGFIFLSLYDFSQHGTATYAAFTGWQYFWAYTAGVANLLAFVALTLALKHLSVVKVSILNISQLALAPLAGLIIFHENMNTGILLGICLTIFGIVVANTGGQGEQEQQPGT